MAAFLASLFFIFAAEMGDKTQLVSLAFATRYNVRVVLVGITLGTLIVHLFSVFLGEVLGLALPTFWIGILAGLAFIGFGLWTLRGDELDDEGEAKEHPLGPTFTVGLTFFLAELGDKTMLATITLSSQYNHDFVQVWAGSTIGMVAADGLAVIVGRVLGKRLPENVIKIGAALIFIATGIFTLVETIFFSK